MTRYGPVRIETEAPSDGADLRSPYVVTVSCEHGRTRLHWRRTCGNGCHQGGPERAAGCARVFPGTAELAMLGALGHARRVGCECGDAFWMVHGPSHAEYGGHWVIQVDERQASAEDYADLEAAGPSVDPWAPVC